MTNYQVGARFEYRVRDDFRNKGWWAMRLPRSAGGFDIIAIRQGEVVATECQVRKYFAPKKVRDFTLLVEELGIQGRLAWKENGKIVFKEVK